MNAARERLEFGLRDVPLDEPQEVADQLRYEMAGTMDQPATGEYLVRGLIDAAVAGCIYGESGTGKSSVAIELATCVSADKPFFGRRVNSGAVLYLAGEGGRGLRNRIIAARMAGEVPADLPLAVVRAPVLLDTADAARVIAAATALATETGQPVRLIVIDTLARSLIGDENSTQDMGIAIRAIEAIRDATSATVLIVHHAGKDTSKGARGSSALRAALDTELLVEGRENPRTMSVTKQRDLPMAGPVSFTLESVQVGTDFEGEPITAAVVRDAGPVAATPKAQGKQQKKLLAELERLQAGQEDRMHWTIAELREVGRDLRMHKNTASSAVTSLLQLGLLIPQVGGNYLASYVPPQDRKDRNGPKRTNSARTTGTEKTEVSIGHRSSVRASVLPLEESP